VVRLWSYPPSDRAAAAVSANSSAAEATCVSQLGAGMRQARFSPRTEGVVLVAGYDQKLNLFDVTPAGLQYVHTLSKHDKNVLYVAWDRDGKLVLSVSEDSVQVWDPRQLNPARSLARPQHKFSCASFHPAHGSSVLVGGYQNVWHWEWAHDTLAQTHGGSALRSQWRAHDGVVSAMACSVRLDQLATVSHDSRVKLWKIS
jgi:WD40 repeat protein